MKAYKSYMDKVTIDPALQQKIVSEEAKTASKNSGCANKRDDFSHKEAASSEIGKSFRSRVYVLRLAGVAASVAALLAAVLMIPGIGKTSSNGYESVQTGNIVIPSGDVGLPAGDPAIPVYPPYVSNELPSQDSEHAAQVPAFDLPPEFINEEFTETFILEGTLLDFDPDFGLFLSYIPASAPDGFIFEETHRVRDTWSNFLAAFWQKDYPSLGSISWTVARPTENDFRRIVSAGDRHMYDVSLYPVPWSETVPSEYRYFFLGPVFLADEISLETVQARTKWFDADRDAEPGWVTIDFSVLLDDVIIRISAGGATAEQIWGMLEAVI